jgi:hypothetical protein
MITPEPSVRIVPVKAGELFTTLFFGFVLFMVSQAFLNAAKFNGQAAHGGERWYFLAVMSIFVLIPLAGLIMHGRRLIPGSPFDFIEVGPQGLTVGTLFGQRHRRWEEITGITVGNIPLTSPPIIWIKVESERPLRFLMGGYVKFKLFSWTKTRVRDIAQWLDLVRRSYAFGDGVLPPPPDALAGKIIPMTRDRASASAQSGVIERRS